MSYIAKSQERMWALLTTEPRADNNSASSKCSWASAM